jgi:hypothetical protein
MGERTNVCVYVYVCVGLCRVCVYILTHIYILNTYKHTYVHTRIRAGVYSLKRNPIVAEVRPELCPAGDERPGTDDIDCCIATDGGRRAAVVNSVFKDIHTYLVCAEKYFGPLAVDLQDSHFRLREDFS